MLAAGSTIKITTFANVFIKTVPNTLTKSIMLYLGGLGLTLCVLVVIGRCVLLFERSLERTVLHGTGSLHVRRDTLTLKHSLDRHFFARSIFEIDGLCQFGASTISELRLVQGLLEAVV